MCGDVRVQFRTCKHYEDKFVQCSASKNGKKCSGKLNGVAGRKDGYCNRSKCQRKAMGIEDQDSSGSSSTSSNRQGRNAWVNRRRPTNSSASSSRERQHDDERSPDRSYTPKRHPDDHGSQTQRRTNPVEPAQGGMAGKPVLKKSAINGHEQREKGNEWDGLGSEENVNDAQPREPEDKPEYSYTDEEGPNNKTSFPDNEFYEEDVGKR